MLSRLRLPILSLALALTATPILAASDGAGPDLAPGAQTVFLPYLNAPLAGAALRFSPRLAISVNGGRPVRAIMDTGSTGIVLAARLIPNFAALPVLKKGQLTYTSSGRIMKGVWVQVPVTVSGTNGTKVTTRPVPVLAVTHVTCTRTARDCRPRANPANIAMLGIGFARDGEITKLGVADQNPFLSLPAMGTPSAPGAMRRGYLITRQGIQLGLSADTAKAMTFVKLDKAADGADWQATPACLSLGGRTPAACGTALVDTGVAVMYLTLPQAQLDGQTQPDARGLPTPTMGTSLNIAFGANGSGPSYSFQAGNMGDPSAPRRITLVERAGRPTFVNTSVRLLNTFNYLYDADGGYVGFRPVSAP